MVSLVGDVGSQGEIVDHRVVINVDRGAFEVIRNGAIANRRDLVALAQEGTRREGLTIVEVVIELDHAVVAIAGFRGGGKVVGAGCRAR